MANKFTVNLTVSLVHASGTASGSASQSLTLTGVHFVDEIQDFAAGAWEALDLGDIATLGYLWLKNTDAVNYIEVATANDGTGIFAKFVAGHGNIINVQAASTYYIRANTATVKVHMIAAEI